MPVIRSFNSNSVVIQTIFSKFVLIRTLYSKFYVIRILCIRIYIVICTHLYASSTSSTYIALQCLGVFDLSMLCMSKMSKMHSIECIEYCTRDQSNVEDVEDRSNTPKGCNVMYVEDVKDRSNTPIFNIFDIALIFCTVFNAFNAMYLNTSNIKQCALTHIGTHPLMYTQRIR